MKEKLPLNRAITFGLLTLFGLVLDLVSKSVAFETYPLRSGSDWLINTGAVRFRFLPAWTKERCGAWARDSPGALPR